MVDFRRWLTRYEFHSVHRLAGGWHFSFTLPARRNWQLFGLVPFVPKALPKKNGVFEANGLVGVKRVKFATLKSSCEFSLAKPSRV